MASGGIGRSGENSPWKVVAIFGSGPTGKIHELSVDDAIALARELETWALLAQERNKSFRPTLRLIDGEGSNLRIDAQTERHLRSV